jgi:hypothetical protein
LEADDFMRLVKVSAWELTVRELDDVTVEGSTTEPEYAAELRRLKPWRRDHPASPPKDDGGRAYLVLR